MPPPIREEGSFPCVFGKEFPVFPSHLKRRRSPQDRGEELQGRATFPESPRCLSPFQGKLFSLHCLNFQAEDRLTPRWHVGQRCGKASWESLVGMTRGKSTDPLIHVKGSVYCCYSSRGNRTCMPPLEMRTDYPRETPEVPQDPVSTVEKTSGPAPTPKKILGPGIDGRGIPRGPRATRMGTGLS